jgi:protein TonB
LALETPRGPAGWLAAVRDAARQRKLASLAIALALEGLILLLLLILGANLAREREAKDKITTFEAKEFAAPPAPDPQAETPPAADAPDTPQTDQLAPLTPVQPSPLVLRPQPAPPPSPARSPPPAARERQGSRRCDGGCRDIRGAPRGSCPAPS